MPRAGLLISLAPLLSVQVHGMSSDAVQSSIPGIPGRDYPTLATVPPTLFSCRAQVILVTTGKLESRSQVQLNFCFVSWRLMVASMLIQRQAVKLFTCAQMMATARESWDKSAFFVQTGPCSSRNTSPVTGGSTWTAAWPGASGASTPSWRVRGRPTRPRPRRSALMGAVIC